MILKTKRLYIKEVSSDSAYSITEYYKSTREKNQQYEPVRTEAFYSENFWLKKLNEYETESFDERGARFLLILKTNQITSLAILILIR